MKRMKCTAIGILLTAAAVALLPGCIENPGPDPRLDDGRRAEYHLVAHAWLAGEPVLELSIKQDSGVVGLRIHSLARETIDSAAFLLQFGGWMSYTAPGLYLKPSKLEVMVRIADLQPGAVLDYGAISPDMDLGGTHTSAKMIRFAAGAPRGTPLGGVYWGNYALVDTAGYPYRGSLQGIITVDGEYQFLMETGPGSSVKGVLHGKLDTAGLGDGILHVDTWGGANYPTSFPAPFSVNSGALKGTFRPAGNAPRFDSLVCDLQPKRFAGE